METNAPFVFHPPLHSYAEGQLIILRAHTVAFATPHFLPATWLWHQLQWPAVIIAAVRGFIPAQSSSRSRNASSGGGRSQFCDGAVSRRRNSHSMSLGLTISTFAERWHRVAVGQDARAAFRSSQGVPSVDGVTKRHRPIATTPLPVSVLLQ